MFLASRFFITLFVVIAGVGTTLFGQINSVDPTYNAVPSLSLLPPEGNPTSVRQAIQADGKILVWGGNLAVQGVAKGLLVRLNSDGTLDNSFSYCHCGITSFGNAAPLPDGKILVAGATTDVGAKVIRLNNDGSLDPTFNFIPPVNGTNSTALIAAVQPDGRFFITRFWAQFGFSATDLYHINADGAYSSSFTGVSIGSGSPNFSSLGAIEVLADGRFYVAINTFAPFTTLTSLKRYLATGAVDTTWETPSFGAPFGFQAPSITGLDTQSDGSLLVSGDFETINGVSKIDLVRLMTAGNVDIGFTGPASFRGTGVKVLTSGQILFSSTGGLGEGERIYRLNSNGTLDGTYVMDASITTIRNPWVMDTADRVIFAAGNGLVRLLVDGARDTSFNPNIGLYGQVHSLARQTDGKVIVAGEFTAFNGVPTIKFVRTNSDGTLDTSYNTGTGFNASPTKMIVQSDGKLLVIGPFTSYNGTAAPGIIRLMSDGTVDSLFSVTPSTGSQILAIELLSDGRMYIAGNFSTINGTARPGVARLQSNGALDTAFNALIGGSPNISAVVVQPDTKVLLGGSFGGVGGFNRSNFVRVDSTGALDQPFNPTNTVAGRIYLTGNGKILTTSSNQGDTQTIVRRNSDGSVDTSFTSVNFQGNSTSTLLDSILVRPDGSIIVGGFFNRVGTSARSGIVRLTPSGSLDALFLPGSSDNRIRTIIESGTDKVLIGGDFTRIENITKAGIARLNVAPFRKVTPFDFDGDGRADFSVFRPSTNIWYTLRTSDWQVLQTNFGLAGDIVAPADFDGDGKTDLGIYRPATGDWWYAASSLGGAHRTTQHGINGDIPRPSDFDGDGKADFIVYRPSNNTWYRKDSIGNVSSVVFGAAGDQPLVGDFDGDGKSDPAIFRPSTGDWWYAASSAGGAHRAAHWGAIGDLPAPGDYDGDGKTDTAVFRPSEGGWYIYHSSNGSVITTTFGLGTDRPIPADYDGDGSADIAVFRPSTGIWYLLQTTAGFGGVQWGVATDVVVPNAFVP
jgi:uncharacterized delta-60 repeat protein